MSIDKIIASISDKSEADRKKMRANAERLLSNGTEPQKAQARQMLDALDAQTAAERKTIYDRLSGMTVAARVVEAFRKHPPTPTEEKMIRALLDNPHSSSTVLSRACGWDGTAWQLHFGTMCKAREAYLWPAETYGKHETSFYSGILAAFDRDGARFTMKPDVAAAFAELGIAATTSVAVRPPGGA